MPSAWKTAWSTFCQRRAGQATHWESMEPFRFAKLREAAALLETTREVLGWQGQNLIRWVSSALCGDSKRLERRQRSIEALLREISAGNIADLEALGILPMPVKAEFAGPLRLRLGGRLVDGEALETTALTMRDLESAEGVACAATRLLTVENKTVFLDLTRQRSGDLIVWTSFPGAATLALLALLPPSLEYWHFGDTDPFGFHILDDLCRRTGRPFRPFRMSVRPRPESRALSAAQRRLLAELALSPRLAESRPEIAALLAAGTVGSFEQEEHQPAPLPWWPFY